MRPFDKNVPNVYREESGSDAPHQEASHLSSNFKLELNQRFSF